jgi:hypothetical protein
MEQLPGSPSVSRSAGKQWLAIFRNSKRPGWLTHLDPVGKPGSYCALSLLQPPSVGWRPGRVPGIGLSPD